MNALTFSASRRHDKVVILSAIDLAAEQPAPLSSQLSRALTNAVRWTACHCTPARLIKGLFSPAISLAVGATAVAAIGWHNITITDIDAMQHAVGRDCLLALPWAAVWAIRATITSFKEGGEA